MSTGPGTSTTAPPGAGLQAELSVPGRVSARLHARPGETVALIGPNGAGKTSLVHALTGLVPAEGRAVLDGTDLLALPTREREVGLVFQGQLLFPHLTALDNVAFGPRSRGTARAEAGVRAQELLDRFGIGDLAHRRPHQLSGGQAQRVALARALVTEPRLLLLDEPFSGLDVTVAMALRIELGRHLAEFGGVAVLVTHEALDALTLADRVLVLEQGRVAQEGPPQEVAARPATDHVARLVGLNLVRDDDGSLSTFSPREVTVSLREPEGSARLRWYGVLTSAQPHGDAVRLLVEVERAAADGPERPGGHPPLLADVTPQAATELGLAPGREVWLTVKATAVDRYGEAPASG